MTEVIAILQSAGRVIPRGNAAGVLAQVNIQRARKALLLRSATPSMWLKVITMCALHPFRFSLSALHVAPLCCRLSHLFTVFCPDGREQAYKTFR